MKEASRNTADPAQRKGRMWMVDLDDSVGVFVNGLGYVVVAVDDNVVVGNGGSGGELLRKMKTWYGRQLMADLAGKWSVEGMVVRGRPCLSQVESVAGLLEEMDMRTIGEEGGRQIRGPLGCLTTQGEDEGAWLLF